MQRRIVKVVSHTRRQRMKDAERRMRKGVFAEGIRGEEGGREILVKNARHLQRKGAMDEFS